MEQEIIERPEELRAPDSMQGISSSRRTKKNGVYEYALFPNGKENKTRLKVTFNNGDVYDGKAKGQKFEGEGNYTWANGARFNGTFADGKLSKGKYTAANGDVYEGKFDGNKYCGEGKYTWADGSTFEGTFKNGKMLKGKYTNKEGEAFECEYIYKSKKRVDCILTPLGKADGKKNEVTEQPQGVKQEEKKEEPKTSVKKTALKKGEAKILSELRKSADFDKWFNGAFSNKTETRKMVRLMILETNSNADQIKRIIKSAPHYEADKHDKMFDDLVATSIKKASEYKGKKANGAGNAATNAAGAQNVAAR